MDETSVKDNEVILSITKLLDLEEESKKVIEEKAKNHYVYNGSTSSYYNNNYNRESDFRTIYFYEYSNIDSTPRVFSRVSNFVTWAKSNGVLISSTMEHTLKTMPTAFCACREGSATLITRCSRHLLIVALKETTAITTRSEGSYPYDDDDYYDNRYEFWD